MKNIRGETQMRYVNEKETSLKSGRVSRCQKFLTVRAYWTGNLGGGSGGGRGVAGEHVD